VENVPKTKRYENSQRKNRKEKRTKDKKNERKNERKNSAANPVPLQHPATPCTTLKHAAIPSWRAFFELSSL